MFTSSILLVLSEVLEAAMLFSLLIAMHQGHGRPWRVIAIAMVVGALGAMLFSGQLDQITEMLDGTGQEWLNASLHLAIFLAMAGFLAARGKFAWQSAFMVLAFLCAWTREGSEILIYLQSFFPSHPQLEQIVLGALSGLLIGLSLGVLLFFAVRALYWGRWRWLALCLFAVFAGNMLSQSTQMLVQAGVINVGMPVWNSSHWLSESSLAGRLSYAVFGYEATPNAAQLGSYVGGMLLMLLLAYWLRKPQS